MWQDDNDRPPTFHELERWEAHAKGEGNPDHEWVLTNFDTWVRNPYYTGPRTEGHPEDHDEDCTGHRCEDGFVPPPEVSPWLRGEGDPEPEINWDDDLPF